MNRTVDIKKEQPGCICSLPTCVHVEKMNNSALNRYTERPYLWGWSVRRGRDKRAPSPVFPPVIHENRSLWKAEAAPHASAPWDSLSVGEKDLRSCHTLVQTTFPVHSYALTHSHRGCKVKLHPLYPFYPSQCGVYYSNSLWKGLSFLGIIFFILIYINQSVIVYAYLVIGSREACFYPRYYQAPKQVKK